MGVNAKRANTTACAQHLTLTLQLHDGEKHKGTNHTVAKLMVDPSCPVVLHNSSTQTFAWHLLQRSEASAPTYLMYCGTSMWQHTCAAAVLWQGTMAQIHPMTCCTVYRVLDIPFTQNLNPHRLSLRSARLRIELSVVPLSSYVDYD